MKAKTEIQSIQQDIQAIKTLYTNLLQLLPSFDVTDRSVLPYGLKAHTRSVSWLVEQVVTQQTKYHAQQLGIDDCDFNMPDTCLHDCIITTLGNTQKYYVNVKVHNVGGKENKNDIAAVSKLYMEYSANSSYNLLYACIGIRFEDITIKFDTQYIEVFSPQFLPIYVNPRNDKVQAFYHHAPELRTRKDFLELLRQRSKSIKL